MLLSADDRLSRARIVLDHRGRAAEDLLPRMISESWSRCLAVGLDPKRPPSVPVLEAHGLQRAREQSALLRRLARTSFGHPRRFTSAGDAVRARGRP